MSTPPARPVRRAPRRAMAPVTAPPATVDPPVDRTVDPALDRSIDPAVDRSIGPAVDRSIDPSVERAAGVRLEKPPVGRPVIDEAPTDIPSAPVVEPSEEAVTAEPVPEAAAPVRRGLSAAALALVLVAVLALGGAGVAFVRAHQLRDTDSARNLALVDTRVTDEVVGQVSVALNRIFSYDYANPKPTQDAATALLTGDAAGQYKTIFDALQSKASGQQLTLKAKSVIGGVSSLTDDSARLLIFLDQSSTRATDSSTSTAAAQLSVEAVKQDGIWKISQIRPL